MDVLQQFLVELHASVSHGVLLRQSTVKSSVRRQIFRG